jgi:hypothetical protein
MQWNSEADQQDLVSDITFWTGVDTTKYTLKARARSANAALGVAWMIIFESYGGAKFMDDNQSDTSSGLPYSDQTITSGTGLYPQPTGAVTIEGVEMMNVASTPLRPLFPMTHEEFMARGGDAAFPSNGVPQWYMWQGDVLRLLPIPNFTLASALRIFFGKAMTKFASTDTTASPGFAADFHRYLSISASLDWVSVRGPKDVVPTLTNLKLDYERRMRSYYAKRFMARMPNRIGAGVDIVAENS